MSVWIQSLFSALLPLPPKLMWQKMENHEWLCLRLVWGTVTTVWSRGAQEDKSICHSGKKGMTSPDSPLLSEGLRLPVLGRSTEPQGSPACQWANLGHLHLWQRICCREVPAQLRSAGGEADACPASRWWSHSSAAFVPGGGNVS